MTKLHHTKSKPTFVKRGVSLDKRQNPVKHGDVSCMLGMKVTDWSKEIRKRINKTQKLTPGMPSHQGKVKQNEQ